MTASHSQQAKLKPVKPVPRPFSAHASSHLSVGFFFKKKTPHSSLISIKCTRSAALPSTGWQVTRPLSTIVRHVPYRAAYRREVLVLLSLTNFHCPNLVFTAHKRLIEPESLSSYKQSRGSLTRRLRRIYLSRQRSFVSMFSLDMSDTCQRHAILVNSCQTSVLWIRIDIFSDRCGSGHISA
jgi:hypothetical protein